MSKGLDYSSSLILNHKIWVPIKFVADPTQARKDFTKSYYDDKACKSGCDVFNDGERSPEHEYCKQCPANGGTFKLYAETETSDGEVLWGFPSGASSLVRQHVPDIKKLTVVDQRPLPKMSREITFTGTLRPEQDGAVDAFWEKNGLLVARPRTGKTVMATAYTCEMGVKTLIIASQVDWLRQFLETFVGGSNGPALTNLREVEGDKDDPNYKQIIGFPKTVEDFEKFDICLCTYQTFLSELGQAKFKKVRGLFGSVIVDEVQFAASAEFCRVMGQINARYKLGLTGTPDRKDGKFELVEFVIGPIVHTIESTSLVPDLVYVVTGHDKKAAASWVNFIRQLERNEKRHQIILDLIIKYVDLGKSIVVPCLYTSQIDRIVSDINSHYDCKESGKLIAEAFTGKTKDRNGLLKRAREGETKVVVGIRSIVATGINVPLWEVLLNIYPASNPPKMQQEFSRILTPMPGKGTPTIVTLLDDTGPSRGCLRTFLSVMKNVFAATSSPENSAILKEFNKSDKKRSSGSHDNKEVDTRDTKGRRLI